MDVKELTDLLVKSSQRTNQAQYIPRWPGNHQEQMDCYDIFEKEVVEEAEACLANCPKEALLTTGGAAKRAKAPGHNKRRRQNAPYAAGRP